MQGRHTGPFVRVAGGGPDTVLTPTGREVDTEQLHVLTVRDGQVRRHRTIRDDIAMLGQLRAFPPHPATLVRMPTWRATRRAAGAARIVTGPADHAARLV